MPLPEAVSRQERRFFSAVCRQNVKFLVHNAHPARQKSLWEIEKSEIMMDEETVGMRISSF
jgi:hypothetical protein